MQVYWFKDNAGGYMHEYISSIDFSVSHSIIRLPWPNLGTKPRNVCINEFYLMYGLVDNRLLCAANVKEIDDD